LKTKWFKIGIGPKYPTMDNKHNIPITRPFIEKAEIKAAQRPIRSGWVTQGPEVAAFENEFRGFVGADHACAVSSCTAALHLALLVVGIKPGDEVITVSHSFIATANSILYCGAAPVFVDIIPGTYNIDPELVERAITPRTKAVLCVHQMGMPCCLEKLMALTRRYSLPLVEDAACAVGSEILIDNSWEKIGKPHGDIACFSFHPRKVLTTGDGGMITTRHEDWDRQFRLLRQHGMSVTDKDRHEADTVVFESYDCLGYNYRMTDIQAAIGREQLCRLPAVVEKRRALARRYEDLLSGIEGLEIPHEPTWTRSNWQSYCVMLPENVGQKATMEYLLKHGIATRRGIMCAHREPAYSNHTARYPLPLSENAQDRCILLPLFPQLEPTEQDRVAAVLQKACMRR